MSSASKESMHFLASFGNVRQTLSTAVKFVPHYHIFSMEPGPKTANYCTDAHGRFCTDDPDGSGPITGPIVIQEDLRQLCIHELEETTPKSSTDENLFGPAQAEKYWRYVELMMERCPLDGQDERRRFGERCSMKLMREVGINVSAVKACVRSNPDEKLWKQRTDVAWGPRALRINGWRYSGAKDGAVVARAICASFESPPPACLRVQSELKAVSASASRPHGTEGHPAKVEPDVHTSSQGGGARGSASIVVAGHERPSDSSDASLNANPSDASLNGHHHGFFGDLSIGGALIVIGSAAVIVILLRRRNMLLQLAKEEDARLEEQLYNRLG